MDTTSPSSTSSLDHLHSAARASAQRLRNTLRLNGATSLIGGLAAAAAPATLDRLLGTGHPGWVGLVGTALALYALALVVLAGSQARRLVRWTPLVVAADATWVLATVVLVAAGRCSTAGAVTVTLVALMVGAFAWRQQSALSAVRSSGDMASIDESPPIEIAAVAARVDASVPTMWAVITDHDLYGRLAPNLSGVRATAPDGPELTRTCSNRAGEEWHETCTSWEPGRRFAVDVDTDHYPYPLHSMAGEWSVRPDGSGSTVGMRFAFQPASGPRGRLFALAMQAVFPLVLHRILRGWRRVGREGKPAA